MHGPPSAARRRDRRTRAWPRSAGGAPRSPGGTWRRRWRAWSRSTSTATGPACRPSWPRRGASVPPDPRPERDPTPRPGSPSWLPHDVRSAYRASVLRPSFVEPNAVRGRASSLFSRGSAPVDEIHAGGEDGVAALGVLEQVLGDDERHGLALGLLLVDVD